MDLAGGSHGARTIVSKTRACDARRPAHPPDVPCAACPQMFKARLTMFYGAPVIQYMLQTISFLALLVIFSFSALLPTESLQSNFVTSQTLFLISFVWMTSLIVDELRQIGTLGWHAWWDSTWNRWDFVTYFLYVIAFGLRLSTDKINLGRSRYVYSIVAAMLWMRLAKQYAVNRSLGPQLIMIQLMVCVCGGGG